MFTQKEIVVDKVCWHAKWEAVLFLFMLHPMMIAAMEGCAVECLNPFLEEGETSVGVMMNTLMMLLHLLA